ncbi:MAG: hypothetical protein OEW62_00645 [Candidatus Bathyarchaeota archaeon]|nr:hypothetical protein [Candidatus Bathyarchaeota archaeon]
MDESHSRASRKSRRLQIVDYVPIMPLVKLEPKLTIIISCLGIHKIIENFQRLLLE